MLNFKEKLLAFGIVFTMLFAIGSAVSADWYFNPFTQKLDYYSTASISSGGGGSSVWSTSTPDIIYYNNEGKAFVIGGTATTSDVLFEVIGDVAFDVVKAGTWNGTALTDAYVVDTITASNYLALTAWYATTTKANLSITESQISDLTHYTDSEVYAILSATTTLSNLSITESQISDLQSYLLATDINTYTELNTIVADQTLAYSGGAFHDGFSDFVADEHIDWKTASQGTIHATNYVDNNTTYVAGDFAHDSLASIPANDHLDWTLDLGATNIHAGNYTDTNTTPSDSTWTIHDSFPAACGANNFVSAIGDTLTCSVPTNTTYTAGGTLLDLTGTTFSINEGTLTDTKICTYESASGLVCNTTAGTGDVTKVGTPVDNQIGVWTGDGTLEGVAGLTYNGSALTTTGSVTGNGVSSTGDLSGGSISLTGEINIQGSIRDGVSLDELIKFSSAGASAINEITIANAAAGNPPELQATGGDTNIDLKLVSKGTGQIDFNGNYKFPLADGTADYVLKTDGSGALSWVAQTNTTYLGGTNLTLAGTTFNVDDAFLLNNGDTGTGVYDFGGAVVEIPNGATPTVDSAGEIAEDTSHSGQLISGADARVYMPEKTICYTIASSSPLISGDTFDLASFDYGITVYKQSAIVANGTSVVAGLTDGTNDMTTITATTTRAFFTPASNNTFTKNENIKIEFGTNTGSSNTLNYCAYYRITRE